MTIVYINFKTLGKNKNAYKMKNIILLIFSTSISIIIILNFFGFTQINNQKTEFKNEIKGPNPTRFDFELGWSPSPNIISRRIHHHNNVSYDMNTDSIGARLSRSYGNPTLQNNMLITFGGSFSYGHGVESENTFTTILGQKLKLPALNFAYPSWGTVQTYKLIKKHATEGSIVIYGYIDDHLWRNFNLCGRSYDEYCLEEPVIYKNKNGKFEIQEKITGHYQLPDGFREVDHKNIFSMKNLTYAYHSLKHRILKKIHYKLQGKKAIYGKERELAFKFIINEIENIAKQRGFKFYIVNVDCAVKNFKPKFEKIIQSQNTVLIDAANFDCDTPDFWSDKHPSEKQHLILAKNIQENL